MKLKILFLYFLVLSLYSYSQEQHIEELVCFPVGQDYGLSQLNASRIAFDSDGYLWIGTENGLNRFNAYEMKTYMAEEPPYNLSDDHIRDMFFEKDTLWLANNTHTLSAYLKKENRFINFNQQIDYDAYPNARFANKIMPIDSRYLLIGANEYLLVFDKKQKDYQIIALPKEAENDYVTAIFPFNADSYLIGTNANGIFQFDLADFKLYRNPIFDSWNQRQIRALYKNSSQSLLISCNKALYEFDIENNSAVSILETNAEMQQITNIFPWDEEHIFLSSLHHGYLMTKDKKLTKLEFVDLDNKPIEVEVSDIQQDASQAKWLATKGRGLLYYHPNLKKFSPKRIKADLEPRSYFISIFNFIRDENLLWLATEFGFAQYNFDTENYKFYPKPHLEYSLAIDHRGQLWGAGFGQGLVRYDSELDDFVTIDLATTDKDVVHITPLDENEIWVHTWSDGIYSLDLNSFVSKKLDFSELNIVRPRTSLVDSDGFVWIGTDQGVLRTKGDSIRAYTDLSNPRVFALAEDQEKNIWIGTAKGLNKLNPDTGIVQSFSMKEGMPNDFVYGLEVDKYNHVWFSTNYGLSEYNPVNQSFKNYTHLDGLQNNEFNGKASYKDAYDNLYFGGMDGFNTFHPDSIYLNKNIGKAVIENVLLLDEEPIEIYSGLEVLNLASHQNVISFTYSSLNFLWPEKNRFQFKLEGFDKNWRPITKNRSTTYTNLSPGDYVFKLKASNNENLWSEVRSLKISIHPPWYRSFWFNSLLVIGFTCAVVGFYLFRINKEKKYSKKMSVLVDKRTQQLLESNKELQKALKESEEQKERVTYLMRELNHRVKNNLQIITSLIDIQDLNLKNQTAKDKLKMLQGRIFIVARIHDVLAQVEEKDYARLDKLIEDLTEEIILFSGSEIQLDLDLEKTKMPKERLIYAGLILNELMVNAIKHAFPKEQSEKIIHVKLESYPDCILFCFCDNGIGFNIEENVEENKMGLSLIKYLIEELNGTMKLDTEKGTKYYLNFIRETRYEEDIDS